MITLVLVAVVTCLGPFAAAQAQTNTANGIIPTDLADPQPTLTQVDGRAYLTTNNELRIELHLPGTGESRPGFETEHPTADLALISAGDISATLLDTVKEAQHPESGTPVPAYTRGIPLSQFDYRIPGTPVLTVSDIQLAPHLQSALEAELASASFYVRRSEARSQPDLTAQPPAPESPSLETPEPTTKKPAATSAAEKSTLRPDAFSAHQPFRSVASPSVGCAASDVFWFNDNSTIYESRVTNTEMTIVRRFRARAGTSGASGYGDIAVSPDNTTLWGVEFAPDHSQSASDGLVRFRLDTWDISKPQARKVATFILEGDKKDVAGPTLTPDTAGELNSLSYGIDPTGRPRLLTASSHNNAIFSIGLDQLRENQPYRLSRSPELLWPEAVTGAGDFISMPDGNIYGLGTKDPHFRQPSVLVKWAPGNPEGQVVDTIKDGAYGMGRVGDRLVFPRINTGDVSNSGSRFFWHQFDPTTGELHEGTLLHPEYLALRALWGAASPGDGAAGCDEALVEIRTEFFGNRGPADQVRIASGEVDSPGVFPHPADSSGQEAGLQPNVFSTYAPKGRVVTVREYSLASPEVSSPGSQGYVELRCVRSDRTPQDPDYQLLYRTWSDTDPNSPSRHANVTIPAEIATARPAGPAVQCTFSHGFSSISGLTVVEYPHGASPDDYDSAEAWQLNATPTDSSLLASGSITLKTQAQPVRPGHYRLSATNSQTGEAYRLREVSCVENTAKSSLNPFPADRSSFSDAGATVDSAEVELQPYQNLSCTFYQQPKLGSVIFKRVVSESDHSVISGSTWLLQGPNGFEELTLGEKHTQPDGSFLVKDLPWGSYTLTEITPPAGNSSLVDPVQFEISSGVRDIQLSVLAPPLNLPQLNLPDTGGQGFMNCGNLGMIAVLGGFLLALSRREFSALHRKTHHGG